MRDERAGGNGLVAEIVTGENLTLGLGVEPTEHLAGDLFIPNLGALVGEIDADIPARNASIIPLTDSSHAGMASSVDLYYVVA